MTTWNLPTANYKQLVGRFLETGAPLPDGLTLLGRWHAPGSSRGWLLVEGDDATLLAQHLSEWGSFLEFDVTPVLEDEQASVAASNARDA